MTKYTKYYDEARKISLETGLKSDSVAMELASKYPEIQPATFARRLRKDKVLEIYYHQPKVLLLDIETSPIIAGAWSFWGNPMQSMVFKRPLILSWSAKWFFSDNILSDVLTYKEVNNNKDKRIIKAIYKLVDEAEVLIAHNGVKFDFRYLNTRFIENGLPKPTSYQFVDTLRACKKFKFESNRLDYIARNIIGIEGKKETPKNLWFDAINGAHFKANGTKEKQETALKIMEEYNREDVRVLEDVYLWLRGYIPNHPNFLLISDLNKEACPKCLSDNIHFVSEYMTMVNLYPEYRCKDCGNTFRMRKNITDPQKRERLTVNIR
jgi:hypothetical protein